jgi:hypothetical protein
MLAASVKYTCGYQDEEELRRRQQSDVVEFERSTFGPLVTDVLSRFVIKSSVNNKTDKKPSIDEPDKASSAKRVTFNVPPEQSSDEEVDAFAVIDVVALFP